MLRCSWMLGSSSYLRDLTVKVDLLEESTKGVNGGLEDAVCNVILGESGGMSSIWWRENPTPLEEIIPVLLAKLGWVTCCGRLSLEKLRTFTGYFYGSKHRIKLFVSEKRGSRELKIGGTLGDSRAESIGLRGGSYDWEVEGRCWEGEGGYI